MRSSVAVALVSHQLASAQPTGVDRYAGELATALADRDDVSVVLCAPNERGIDAQHRPGWVPDHVPVRRVRGPRRAVIAGWWTVGRPRVDAACGAVDIVHLTLPLFPCPTRRPLVCTIHDLYPVQHPEWYSRRDRFAVGRALRSLEHAAAVIAVSPSTAAALAELPWVDPAIVSVVPEGVSRRFAPDPDPVAVAAACRDLRVEPGGFDLFIGQVSTRKDLGVVVEALAQVEDPVPFVLAGPPGDATEAVRRLAEERGVDHLLRWPGFVADEQLHVLLHAARALLHPCPDEGFGLTPLEAMVAGTPVVAADAGALRDTVGDAALRCTPRDVQAWAAAMDRLRNADVRADLIARGLVWAPRFDWDQVAAQTRDVYLTALARS